LESAPGVRRQVDVVQEVDDGAARVVAQDDGVGRTGRLCDGRAVGEFNRAAGAGLDVNRAPVVLADGDAEERDVPAAAAN
jgi:hypothetical protein